MKNIIIQISAPQNIQSKSESSFYYKMASLIAENGISSSGSFPTTLNINLV